MQRPMLEVSFQETTQRLSAQEDPGASGCPASPPEASPLDPAVVPHLPLDTLELICQHLAMRERLSLTGSCRGLWARQDVLSSAALWGVVGASLWRQGGFPPESWLARRQGALRRVLLSGGPFAFPTPLPAETVATALRSLRCSPVSALLVDRTRVWEDLVDDQAAFRPVKHLTSLTQLWITMGDLRSVPSGISVLTSLINLSFYFNPPLGLRGTDTFQPLQHLTALEELTLTSCGLTAVPPQLSALKALKSLSLGGNESMDKSEASWSPLSHLTALTQLDLSSTQLQRLPEQLQALKGLVSLYLSNNSLGDAWGREAWLPLEGLGITHLSIGGSGLHSIPPALSSLSHALRYLNLSENWRLGEGGEGAFEPIAALTALTELQMRRCGLLHLPCQLSALGALQVLQLENNRALGEIQEGVLQPLRNLGVLTHISLFGCGVPRQAAGPGMLGACVGLDDAPRC